MRITLAHDYLNQWGGAERVLKIFSNLYPDATIKTITYDDKKLTQFDNKKIETSFIQKLPFGVKKYKWYLLFMPLAVESLKFNNSDVVLSDSSGMIKGIKVPRNSMHVCYIHTSTRYLTVDKDYFQYSVPKILHPFLPKILKKLTKWDLSASNRPNYYIANSLTTAKRVKKFYKRDVDEVIFPPVETEVFKKLPSDKQEDYYLIAGRLVAYKKVDLAIKTFNKINKTLIVVGTGPEENNLKKIANINIIFKGKVSDEELRKLYSEAKAVIFPPVEDAGMIPLEAMACGTPVIAFGEGGAKESIIDKKTGIFFDAQNIESLSQAIKEFEKIKFNEEFIIAHAKTFSSENFRKKIKEFIDKKYILFLKNSKK